MSKNKSKSRSTGLGKSRYKSSPRKTLEVAAVEIEGCTTSSRRKKSEKQNAEGDIEERKIGIDSNNDMHVEHKESVYPILSLSSNSESCLDHSPKKEIRNNQVEASQQQIPQLISEEAKDKIILGNDGKSPSRKGSKGKSSQKPIHVEEDHSPVKGKKTKGSAKERGMEWVVVEIWRLRRKKLVKSSLRQMSPLQGCLWCFLRKFNAQR
ncbi:uncharacterized protein LOC107612570 isoform X1 [Arachis ipaensis]|uniref:uncharacterized protein LOC107612570 isoform X1 n=1 Tax=Arachis ipaensis TaxID=130454 RepID=UPI000A2AF0FE|nr:uncharacterized protein LOC107612570 isoform X1 [Arachis ipaensis]